MNAFDIASIYGKLGARFYKSKLDVMLEYFRLMLEEGRIITISKDGNPHAIIMFSVGDNPDKFLKKGTWEYVPHDPKGKIVCIEQLISKGWDKDLRNLMEITLSSRFPTAEEAVWYRYAKWGDRLVKAKRRFQNVRN